MVRMSTVWDRTTEFVADNLGAIFPFALVIAAIAAVQDIAGAASADASSATILAVSSIGFVLGLVALVARLAVIVLAVEGGRRGGDVLALVLGRLLAVIGIIVIVGLGFVLLMVPLLVMLVAGGIDLTQMQHLDAAAVQAIPPAVQGGIALYALAIAAGLLWLGARLAVIFPVLLFERLLEGSFARSFALTRGLALRIIGVLIMISVVSGVATLAARTVFGSVLPLILGDGGATGVASILTAIVAAVVMTLFTVIGDAFAGKLYVAARAAEADSAAA
ncbi:MAG: hypothetical protein WC816_09325 [Sphingomonas sp.]|jgi:hypothetical protein